MKANKTIVVTGGGSGGHLFPALELIEHWELLGYKVIFLGSSKHLEFDVLKEKKPHIFFYSYPVGKLRRYLSWKNVKDFFLFFQGIWVCFFFFLTSKSKNKIVGVVSTGGFVSLPPAIAAYLVRIPLFVHEQTSRAGLANVIAGKLATRIFLTYESSRKFFPLERTKVTGIPLRKKIFMIPEIKNEIQKNSSKELLLITGGGNGSLLLNTFVEENFEWLSENFIVIHQVGKNFIENFSKKASDSYWPFSILGEEILDYMKISSVVISRAGAGTVAELMAIKKRTIFVPLQGAQKDEQYFNALEAEKLLGSFVIREKDFHFEVVFPLILQLKEYYKNHEKFSLPILENNPTLKIVNEILKEIGDEESNKKKF